MWPRPSNPAGLLLILPTAAKRRIPDFRRARRLSMTLPNLMEAVKCARTQMRHTRSCVRFRARLNKVMATIVKLVHK